MANNLSFERKFLLNPTQLREAKTYLSPCFIDHDRQCFWLLSLSHLSRDDDERNISLYLELSGGDREEHLRNYINKNEDCDPITQVAFARFSCIVLNEKRKKLYQFDSETAKSFEEGEDMHLAYWGFKNVIDDRIRCWEKPTQLIVICNIDYFDDGYRSYLYHMIPKGYSDLLNSEVHSDIILCSAAGKESFRAHKAILSAHSPVFCKMFEDDPNVGMLKVTDIPVNYLKCFLTFFYTNGTISYTDDDFEFLSLAEEDNLHLELLSCAEKYQMKGLIRHCCSSLCSLITDVSNAAERLMLGYHHQSRTLMQTAMDYTSSHVFPYVKESEGWKLHIASNPALLEEILIHRHQMTRVTMMKSLESLMDTCTIQDTATSTVCKGVRLDQSFTFECRFSDILQRYKQESKYYFLSDCFEDPIKKRLWRLVLLLSGKGPLNPTASLYLQLCAAPESDGYTSPVCVNFSFLILDADNGKHMCHLNHSFDRHVYIHDTDGYEDFMGVVDGHDSIKIVCTIDDYPEEKSTEEIFSENLQNLLLAGFCSDVTLCVEGEELHVHKVVLSARSPVFHAMFTHDDLKENVSSKVVIPDASLACVKAFLNFIYGEVRPDTANVETADLLIMADKYQVKYLKTLCEKKLCKDTTVSNACEHLALANLYQTCTLKETALKMIVGNLWLVRKTEGWEEHIRKDPVVLDQILSFVPVSQFGEEDHDDSLWDSFFGSNAD